MNTREKQLVNEDKEITKRIGRLIAKARRSKGMSQVELAERLRFTQAIISAYELGKRRIPMTQFIKIAKVIGVSPGKILDGDGFFKNDDDGHLSLRFVKRLKEIDKLPDFQKRSLVNTIDAILFQFNEKQKEGNEKAEVLAAELD